MADNQAQPGAQPGNAAQVEHPAPRLPARRGRVFFLRGRNRDLAHRAVLEPRTPDPDAQPQFMPRTVWPAHPQAFANILRPRTYAHAGELAHYPGQHRNAIITGYGDLAPMPAFRPVPNQQALAHPAQQRFQYRDLDWHDHVGVVHNILFNNLLVRPALEVALETIDMYHLIAILTYGVGFSVAWLDQPFTINHQGNDPDSETLYRDEMEAGINMYMKAGDFENTEEFRVRARERMTGKRFLVVPVLTDDEQWSMSVFDRYYSQLYIYDTNEYNREDRVMAIVHTWIRFWNELRMPFHFEYFVPCANSQTDPFPEHEHDLQHNHQFSGYFCLAWLRRFLRDYPEIDAANLNVNPNADPPQQAWNAFYHAVQNHADDEPLDFPLERLVPSTDVVITRPDPGFRPRNPQKETADVWVPPGDTSWLQLLADIRNLFVVMLCNELGYDSIPQASLGEAQQIINVDVEVSGDVFAVEGLRRCRAIGRHMHQEGNRALRRWFLLGDGDSGLYFVLPETERGTLNLVDYSDQQGFIRFQPSPLFWDTPFQPVRWPRNPCFKPDWPLAPNLRGLRLSIESVDENDQRTVAEDGDLDAERHVTAQNYRGSFVNANDLERRLKSPRPIQGDHPLGVDEEDPEPDGPPFDAFANPKDIVAKASIAWPMLESMSQRIHISQELTDVARAGNFLHIRLHARLFSMENPPGGPQDAWPNVQLQYDWPLNDVHGLPAIPDSPRAGSLPPGGGDGGGGDEDGDGDGQPQGRYPRRNRRPPERYGFPAASDRQGARTCASCGSNIGQRGATGDSGRPRKRARRR